jgi:hypothetical protein
LWLSILKGVRLEKLIWNEEAHALVVESFMGVSMFNSPQRGIADSIIDTSIQNNLKQWEWGFLTMELLLGPGLAKYCSFVST